MLLAEHGSSNSALLGCTERKEKTGRLESSGVNSGFSRLMCIILLHHQPPPSHGKLFIFPVASTFSLDEYAALERFELRSPRFFCSLL